MVLTKQNLFDDYFFEIASDYKEHHQFMLDNFSKIYDETIDFFLDELLSEKEKENTKRLSNHLKSAYRLRLYILKNDKRIGWFSGKQEGENIFFMSNTGILKEYQNKGIYKALLPKILEIIRTEGFQAVCSKHRATNNQVIVPKLKAGFMISGIEINDVYGLLITLTFYFNEARRKLIEYRVGQTRPNNEIKKLLKL